MLDGHRIAVVVPAKDEAQWIRGVIQTMPAYVDDLIVVDDGSSDGTGDVAKVLGAIVFRHEVARGVGAAIVSGYRLALELGADAIAVMAGDGQMCPDDLQRLAAPVIAGRADYAKGDRFRHPDIGHTMPRARRIVGGLLSAATGLAIGVPALSDSQCGYTVISRKAALAIDLEALWPRYGYPNDLLSHLAIANQRIVDVTVRPVYRGEASGLRPWHVLKIAALIGRAGLRRISASARGSSPRDVPAQPTAT
ncbi:MAG: glycosyltransferase family 2 protein [Polyangiaceae bacterium]|nr:glycosyltransferase family 2 protein [Polyangiaceae bacterium]